MSNSLSDTAFTIPIRLLGEAARLMADLVPAEAQKHLLNAQRELLLAVALTVDHNSTRRVTKPRATKSSSRSTTASRKKATAAKRPSRVKLD
jgi:hypothetical protein